MVGGGLGQSWESVKHSHHLTELLAAYKGGGVGAAFTGPTDLLLRFGKQVSAHNKLSFPSNSSQARMGTFRT